MSRLSRHTVRAATHTVGILQEEVSRPNRLIGPLLESSCYTRNHQVIPNSLKGNCFPLNVAKFTEAA